MLADKFGKENVENFIRVTMSNDTSSSIDLVSIAELDECIRDEGAINSILKNIKFFSPVVPEVGYTRFELLNFKRILVAFMSLPLGDIPLSLNSNFRLVREIVKWRLKINR